MDELSQHSMQRTKFRRKFVVEVNRSVLILTVLENEGHPLWNGRDEIFIRKVQWNTVQEVNAQLLEARSDPPT